MAKGPFSPSEFVPTEFSTAVDKADSLNGDHEEGNELSLKPS